MLYKVLKVSRRYLQPFLSYRENPTGGGRSCPTHHRAHVIESSRFARTIVSKKMTLDGEFSKHLLRQIKELDLALDFRIAKSSPYREQGPTVAMVYTEVRSIFRLPNVF